MIRFYLLSIKYVRRGDQNTGGVPCIRGLGDAFACPSNGGGNMGLITARSRGKRMGKVRQGMALAGIPGGMSA